MSDSMERDKTELMIRKEKEEEEEEMKRELEAMQMYESWYTYTDMKQILGAINESRDMANMTNDERKKLTHCSNNWIPEATSKSQTQELEAQDHNDASQSMHSYRIIRTSPVHERVPCQGCSTSNVASTVDDFGNPAFRRKFLDNEDTSIHRSQDNSNTRDCYYHTPNRSLSLKLKNTLQDSDATNNPEAAAETMDENCEPERTLERWQINPLDSCVNENDVPLPEPNRPLAEDRMPFRLCKDARTTEELEKLLPVLNHHLKQTAEPWRSRRHAATDDKFQWGSPIQVGHAKDKSDRKSLSNIETEQNQVECTNRLNERPTKRKSSLITSSPDEDEQIFKKKKTQSDEDEDRALCSNKLEPAAGNDDQLSEMSNHLSAHSDNNTEGCETKEEQEESQECTSPALILRPKKVTHPNVRKFLDKRRDVTNPSKGLSDRLKNELMMLEKVQLEKQRKLEAEKEEARRKEMEERNRREEFFKKQLEERQRREQEKREREKHKENQSKNWNTRMETRSKRTIREELDEALDEAPSLNRQIAITTAGTVEDNRMLEDDEVFITEEMEAAASGRTSNVNCPICNRSFPSDRIETHAAECEQYSSDNDGDNDLYLVESRSSLINTDSTLYECAICSKYKTTNGMDYEDHVNTCLERQYEAKSSNEQRNEILNIPNSPIRSFRPISEQTESHIDYRKQFPSSSKAQVHSNRKRKR